MIKKPLFWDVAIFDNNGLAGVSKDATKEQIESYEEYLKEKERASKAGVIL